MLGKVGSCVTDFHELRVKINERNLGSMGDICTYTCTVVNYQRKLCFHIASMKCGIGVAWQALHKLPNRVLPRSCLHTKCLRLLALNIEVLGVSGSCKMR